MRGHEASRPRRARIHPRPAAERRGATDGRAAVRHAARAGGAAAGVAAASGSTRSCRGCCASTASTCGSCRCASTTRTRCSSPSRRPRRSPRGAARSTCSSTSAPRRARRPRPRASSASRSAARRRAASSRRGAPRRRRPGDVGRGRQAELWGDEQWQALVARRRGAQARGDRHRPLDGVRLLRRPLERRARGHEPRARREVDVAVPERRGAAARAHRRAPAGGGGRSTAACRSWCGRCRRRCSPSAPSRRARRGRATSCGGGGSA